MLEPVNLGSSSQLWQVSIAKLGFLIIGRWNKGFIKEMDFLSYFPQMWELALKGELQGVFFYASLYALVMGAYSLVFQMRVAAWPSTRGLLIKADVEKFGPTEWAIMNQDYSAEALYAYEVAGSGYEGKRVSPWVIVASHNAKFVLEQQMKGITQNVDGSVAVYFNPKNPKKSFLIRPGRFGMVFTLAIAVVPISWYLSSYHL